MCVCVLFYVCLSQMLVGSPLLCNLVDSFQGPSFTRDVFLPSFSSKPTSFSYFLSLFNDFQLFIIQRKGFRLKRCPLSAAWSSLLLFSLPRLIHVPLPPPPFFFFFTSLHFFPFELPLSRIFVFHSSLSLANKSFVLERAPSGIV